MGYNAAAGGVVPILSGEQILKQVPGLDLIAEVTVIDFARLPGPHMTPARMLDLARCVAEQLARDEIHGVVITHGTDTLEESAYVLDLLLRSDKPVVFVGSMRNSSELGWDGPANLRSAVRVAADSVVRGLGVLVVLNDQILAAADAMKTHTESVDTFQARDFGPLGIVDKDRLIVNRRPLHHEHISTDRLEVRIDLIKLCAGDSGRLIRAALDQGCCGLVIEGLGRGNVPISAIGEVEHVLKSGIPVVITSRCPRGRILDTYAYEGSGKHLKRLGAILGGMHSSHKARLKLMLLLGAGANVERIRRAFEGTGE